MTPEPMIDRRLALIVGAGAVLLSPFLFPFELVLAPLFLVFGVAFRRMQPRAARRLLGIGVGLSVGVVAYVVLAVVVAAAR